MIPVSAVGPTLARLDENGRMVKRPEGRIDPIHVDLPLYAVLPDALKLAELTLTTAVRDELERDVRRGVHHRVPDLVRAVLNSPLASRLRSALHAVVGDELLTLLIEMTVRKEARSAKPDAGAPADDSQIAQIRELRGDVVEHMNGVVKRLEGRLMSSILDDEEHR